MPTIYSEQYTHLWFNVRPISFTLYSRSQFNFFFSFYHYLHSMDNKTLENTDKNYRQSMKIIRAVAIIVGVIPVSYTHLDVYKRQRNLQDVDVASILRELPLNKPLPRIIVLLMRQQVERMKSAYDKYIIICKLIDKVLSISTWLEVTANKSVISARLYLVISMIMDQLYDYHIICLLYTSRCV